MKQKDVIGTPGTTDSFTPGPWSYSHKVNTDYEFGIYSNDATGSIVAQVGGFRYAPRSLPETIANAHLIAAAPELLEACRQTLHRLDWSEGLMLTLQATPQLQPHLPGFQHILEAVRAAALQDRAAIAKAEGRDTDADLLRRAKVIALERWYGTPWESLDESQRKDALAAAAEHAYGTL